MRALPDVNILIALLGENHVHHAAAADGPAERIRILSQPRYPNALGVGEVVARLQAAVSTPYHRFIADDVSLLDDAVVDRRRLSGPRQVTDIYLLALAIAHGARMVTLDKSVPLFEAQAKDPWWRFDPWHETHTCLTASARSRSPDLPTGDADATKRTDTT